MDRDKKWCLGVLALSCILLIGLGLFTVIVDPYFHYHKPLDSLEYQLSKADQRYQNDGILKHFDYNALIIGTSMTENFKASEYSRLFGVNAVKTPFSGGSYKEINDHLARAIHAAPDLEQVVRGLDYKRLLDKKDTMEYDESFYPTYLYNENILDDVSYIFNRSVLIEETFGTISFTKNGYTTPDFDRYSNWMGSHTFGREAVLQEYERPKKSKKQKKLTKRNMKNIEENIHQNVTDLAEKNPAIDFYLFFTPYSIYYWDSLDRSGTLERQLQAERYAVHLMLPYENIHLFSFFDAFDMICDMDRYKDIAHYSEDINSQILLWMRNGEHQLTQENYDAYWERVHDHYTSYDYDALPMTPR